MNFLSTSAEIKRAISSTVADSPKQLLIAVAFWGQGSQDLLAPAQAETVRLVCNLTSGATHPEPIRRLGARFPVKHNPLLHAKVIIGDRQALIGSANFSDAALGLQRDDGDCWREGCVLVDIKHTAFQQARTWFLQDLWGSSASVTETELDNAQLLFDERMLSPHPPAMRKVIRQELSRDIFFAAGGMGKNEIVMASRQIEAAYERHIGRLDKNRVRIPAFAANLLWTITGGVVENNIQRFNCEFTLPDQVINRATEPAIQRKGTLGELSTLLRCLVSDEEVHAGIRNAAAKWSERTEEEMLRGVHPRSDEQLR